MQTRFTSSIDAARWRAAGIALIVFAALSACDGEETARPLNPICRLNQFRRCEADCGRGVEQCIEPGPRWSDCACTVLDGAPPVGDAAGLDSGDPGDGGGSDADADGADAGDAADAADASDGNPG